MILSPERRAEIEHYLDVDSRGVNLKHVQWLRELLRAHDHWLKAVRELDPFEMDGGDWFECPFCHDDGPVKNLVVHKPDCPWMLSQEGK